ncbi:helix-turn-helix transcriptional regulator [Parahaliea maris]|uniref:Helix-turn-helix transcriptional regulator n=1 Tax=Parahaliea maris TaxID=2716870 RepID=A0A5C8ZTZ1_9GAMM|nr:helix-turn-helix transcriptional regulator [Parahaliea maris]TXS91254.1 helix-turn-helix transcriptional regulator [Parahaliea maris]
MANPAIPISEIQPVREVIAGIGICPDELSNAFDLPPGAFSGSATQTLLLSDYFRILEYLTAQAGDETGRLSTRSIMSGSLAFLVNQLDDCNTVFDVMRKVADTCNFLHGGPYNQIEKRDGYIAYLINDEDFPYTLTNHSYQYLTMECVLIFLHQLLSYFSVEPLTPLLRKTYTRRPRPKSNVPLSCWDLPTRYESANYALIYDRRIERQPVRGDRVMPSTESLLRMVIDTLSANDDNPPRFKNFSEAVTSLFEQGIYDQRVIAKRLHISVATLRRRLEDEGRQFRSLRLAAQNQQALQLLRQPRSIRDISEHLGFSDIRSFSRAFKKLNGVTPKSYRQELADAP